MPWIRREFDLGDIVDENEAIEYVVSSDIV